MYYWEYKCIKRTIDFKSFAEKLDPVVRDLRRYSVNFIISSIFLLI